jgi:hypothetical protein
LWTGRLAEMAGRQNFLYDHLPVNIILFIGIAILHAGIAKM